MANIKQIAMLAGVSVATVSRVLNGHPYVREDKRAAVMKAVSALNYSQNINAIHLVKGKTSMIAVLLPYVNHPYFGDILDGIGQAALEANYQLILCQTNYHVEEEMKVLEMLKMKQIDGIIVVSKSTPWEVIEEYTAYGPIVACENTGDGPISSVFIDHYSSFLLGMKHLIAKGHRRIGYFIARANSYSNLCRKRAYIETMTEIGAEIRPEWLFERVIRFNDGVRVMREILHMKDRPTALFGAGDHPAGAMILEAKKHGLRVPEDIAIMGYDNDDIAEVIGITTIEQSKFDVGSHAFQILFKQINQEQAAPEKKELPFRLIERSSV